MLSVPVYLLLRQRHWLNLWQVVTAGAVLGVLAGILVFSTGGRTQERLLFLGYGALTALVFWLIAFYRASPLPGEHNAA
jgi:hypothetical protein